MKLPSGKEISDDILRDIADGWAKMSLQEEHVADVENVIVENIAEGEYDSIKVNQYDAVDVAAMVETMEEVVIDMVVEMKENYSKTYEKYLADKVFLIVDRGGR